MSRGLHSDITTELAKGSFSMAHLVSITLGTVASPNVYYYTTSSIDIVESGNTYLANGFLLASDPVTESAGMTLGSLVLTVSAVDQTIVSDVLTNGYIHKSVIVKQAFLNSANQLISSNAVFTIYDGNIDGMSIKDSGTSVIQFSVANHWSFFQRKTGRRTTTESQAQFYADDEGFKYMSVSNQ